MDRRAFDCNSYNLYRVTQIFGGQVELSDPSVQRVLSKSTGVSMTEQHQARKIDALCHALGQHD